MVSGIGTRMLVISAFIGCVSGTMRSNTPVQLRPVSQSVACRSERDGVAWCCNLYQQSRVTLEGRRRSALGALRAIENCFRRNTLRAFLNRRAGDNNHHEIFCSRIEREAESSLDQRTARSGILRWYGISTERINEMHGYLEPHVFLAAWRDQPLVANYRNDHGNWSFTIQIATSEDGLCLPMRLLINGLEF